MGVQGEGWDSNENNEDKDSARMDLGNSEGKQEQESKEDFHPRLPLCLTVIQSDTCGGEKKRIRAGMIAHESVWHPPMFRRHPFEKSSGIFT